MPRNDFLVAWLVVATLTLILVVFGTAYFVYRSGLLTGEIPLVGETSTLSPVFEAVVEPDSDGKPTGRRMLRVPVYFVDPEQQLLMPEVRSVPAAPHDLGCVLNTLRALHQTPENPVLRPAVPPQLQFRRVYFDPEIKTVYVDLAKLPDTWKDADPMEVSLSLYAVAHTITTLNPEYQFIRFLVAGRETDARPGGVILSEAFTADEDWLGDEADRSSTES